MALPSMVPLARANEVASEPPIPDERGLIFLWQESPMNEPGKKLKKNGGRYVGASVSCWIAIKGERRVQECEVFDASPTGARKIGMVESKAGLASHWSPTRPSESARQSGVAGKTMGS